MLSVLNLNPSFSFPDDDSEDVIKYESFTFPGGEEHIKLERKVKFKLSVTIIQRIHSSSDLMKLCLAVDALRRRGTTWIELLLPYVPYARQDRVMVKGEPLSIRVFADIINSLDLEKVTIFDPHSDVTPALLNNCEVINNHHFVCKVVEDIIDNLPSTSRTTHPFYLVSPDAGSNKKMKALAYYLYMEGYDFKVVYCDKTRDVATGRIDGFEVYGPDLNPNLPCIIVDDICDGGGTFIGLAKVLKTKKAGDLYLAVSHGIFSKGLTALPDYFKKIYTTDSFIHCDQNNEKLTVYPIGKLL